MYWKTKARIQKAVSLLPSTLSYLVYYQMQRHFGALRRMNPVSRLSSAVETWKLIESQHCSPVGKTFLEVGSGRVPIAPLAYWLMGADRIVTIDLNPYMNSDLLKESLDYIANHQDEIGQLFGDSLKRDRLEMLLGYATRTKISTSTFLEQFPIVYVAPGDAACTSLEDDSVDFHTSHDVLEHIPYAKLISIITEGNRVTRNSGIFVHRIDYSDHFSHTDNSISGINFLQYSDSEWNTVAGNRYMYMNRLRHDDFLSLFEECDQNIVACEPVVDYRAAELLERGEFTIAERFRGKSNETLSIVGSWLVSRQSQASSIAQ